MKNTKTKKSAASKSVITNEMIQWMESLKPYKEFPNKDYYDGYKVGMQEGAKTAIIKYSLKEAEKFKNIYTILEEIDFDTKYKHAATVLHVDEFRLKQLMFGIIQKFYDNILDTHCENIFSKK